MKVHVLAETSVHDSWPGAVDHACTSTYDLAIENEYPEDEAKEMSNAVEKAFKQGLKNAKGRGEDLDYDTFEISEMDLEWTILCKPIRKH